MGRTRSAAGVIGIAVIGGGDAAFGDPPGLELRQPPNTGSEASCVGLLSAGHIRNGQSVTLGQGGDPSHGQRWDEIKTIHESCGQRANLS